MTQEYFFLACGLLSAALSTCAYLPYMRDMVNGAARPLRSTWLIWSILASISASANIAEGASGSLLFVCVQAGFTVLIFLMSLRYGMGSFIEHADARVLLLATLGLLLWWGTDNALWALFISITVSALGGLATIMKTYRAPDTEPASCWIVSSAAALAGLISVGPLNPVLLTYPAYLLVLYLSILCAKYLGAQAHVQTHVPVVRPIPLLLARAQRVA